MRIENSQIYSGLPNYHSVPCFFQAFERLGSDAVETFKSHPESLRRVLLGHVSNGMYMYLVTNQCEIV